MSAVPGGAQPAEGGAADRPLVLMLTADRQIDRRILLEADALESAGWSVRILGMPLDRPEQAPDPRVTRLGITPTHHAREFLVLALYRKMRALLPMNSALMRRLKALTWAYFVDQEKFYVDLFLAEALRHPAALVVAHDLPMLPVGARVAKARGTGLVYDSHELFAEQEFSEREKRRWRLIEDQHIRSADCVITVNRSIASELEQRYGLSDVEVILNAERPHQPDPADRTSLRQRLGLGETAVIGLYQGGLSAGRNLETLVRAMPQVAMPELHLVFLGDGQMATPLGRLAAELGVSGSVHFLDAVPQRDLLHLTASADFGIIPYQANCLNTYYCTPNKLFEFIASGVPMVASDLPELRRFVGDMGIGLIGDLSTAGSAAAMLTDMAVDAGRRQAFRERLEVVRNDVSWTVEGERFAAILERFRPNAGAPECAA